MALVNFNEQVINTYLGTSVTLFSFEAEFDGNTKILSENGIFTISELVETYDAARKKQRYIGVYLKILTNYLQSMNIILDFNR